MVVMRLDVNLAAFAAFYHCAMGVVMADIDKQLGFTAAATIGLVAAALAQGFAGGMRLDGCAFCIFRADNDHVELRHVALLR